MHGDAHAAKKAARHRARSGNACLSPARSTCLPHLSHPPAPPHSLPAHTLSPPHLTMIRSIPARCGTHTCPLHRYAAARGTGALRRRRGAAAALAYAACRRLFAFAARLRCLPRSTCNIHAYRAASANTLSCDAQAPAAAAPLLLPPSPAFLRLRVTCRTAAPACTLPAPLCFAAWRTAPSFRATHCRYPHAYALPRICHTISSADDATRRVTRSRAHSRSLPASPYSLPAATAIAATRLFATDSVRRRAIYRRLPACHKHIPIRTGRRIGRTCCVSPPVERDARLAPLYAAVACCVVA